MKIGFIGVGVIASAFIEGLCYEQDTSHDIYLSPRNAEKANKLEKTYKNVEVCHNNQSVLDKAEWIIVSVLPQYGEAVLSALNFNSEHRVVNLMSDRKLPEIKSWIGQTKSLVHLVPLSFISKRSGPIALYPNDDATRELVEPLGSLIVVDDVKEIEAIAAITGLMTSYYALLWDISKWGETHGLDLEKSVGYTTSFFEALSKHGGEVNLETLANEMTPGGFNESALTSIKTSKGLSLWTEALEPILNRLTKKLK